MKRIAAIGIALGLVLGLSACSDYSQEDPGSPSTLYLDTGDGRTVYCIAHGYGMSCDWTNAK